MSAPAHPAPRPRPQPLWAALAVDQFAAQALQAARPALREAAFVVVQQNASSHRAAVYAASGPAIDLGARPGMPVFVLRRRAGRRVQLLRRDEDAEAAARHSLAAALQRWTPSPEVSVIRDAVAAVLDLAGTPASRLWSPSQVGQQLQRHVRRRCGLVAAVGVAGSRLAARLVVGEVGGGGVGSCPPEEEDDLLRRASTGDLPGLGAGCRERAARYGIDCVAQLLQLDRSALVRRLGRDDGLRLYGLVRGLDGQDRRRRTPDFTGQTVLVEDVNDDLLLRQALHLAVDRACHALRSAGHVARRLSLRLTYSDSHRRQRSADLPASSDDFATLRAAADGLFGALHTRRVALRTLAIHACRTAPATGQIDLFAGAEEIRRQQLGRAITDIRRRLGFDAVGTAREPITSAGRRAPDPRT